MNPGARGMRAGNAFLELFLKDSGVRVGLDKIQKQLTGIGAGIQRAGAISAAAGAAITAPFFAAAKLFASAGDQLDKMSSRTGVSVESLSELAFAADRSGTSINTVEKAMAQMQKNGLDPKAFDQYAAEIAAIDDPLKQADRAMEVFGKTAGRQLLPMLRDLTSLRAEARALGVVMSTEDASAAAKLADAMGDVLKQVKALTVQVGASIAGSLTKLLNWSTQFITQAIAWAQANRPLLQTIFGVGLGLVALGATLVAVGTGVQVLAYAFGILSTAIGAVGAVLAFIASPLGIVIALAAGAAAAFLTMTDAGGQMADVLGEKFAWLKDVAISSFSAISAALGAGDIAAAGRVLWATLSLLWLEGTQGLRETWHSMIGGITRIWHAAWAGMLQLGNATWGNIERGWSHTVEFIGNLFDSVVGGIQKAWNSTVAFIQRTWQRIKGLFGADVQGEIDRINRELEVANAAIDERTNASRTERSDRQGTNRERSRKLQDATLDVIGAELAKKLAATDGGTKAAIEAAQSTLEEARHAWGEMKDAAHAIADEAARQKEAVAEQVASQTASVDQLAQAKSTGTFNAAAIRGLLGPSSAEERTAKATERTAATTERLEKKAATGGVAFS